MHTTATIRELGRGYTVVLGPRIHQSKYCESFEDAYKLAAKYVNWDYQYLTIDINGDLQGMYAYGTIHDVTDGPVITKWNSLPNENVVIFQ